MANHKSAEKRSRQAIRKTKVNQVLMSKIRTNYNKFINDIDSNVLVLRSLFNIDFVDILYE